MNYLYQNRFLIKHIFCERKQAAEVTKHFQIFECPIQAFLSAGCHSYFSNMWSTLKQTFLIRQQVSLMTGTIYPNSIKFSFFLKLYWILDNLWTNVQNAGTIEILDCQFLIFVNFQ